VHHYGAKTGQLGGGGIAAAVAVLATEAGAGARRHTPSVRSSRVGYSVDLFARSLASIVANRVGRSRPIVHVHVADGGSLHREGSLARAAHRLGLRTVTSFHTGALPMLVDRHPRRVRAIVRASDVVHVLGTRAEAAIESLGEPGARIAVIPNAVQAPETAGPAGAQPPSVLFAGAVAVRKGVDVLLDAWESVLRDHPDAQLTLVGRNEGIEHLDRPGVRWRGPVRHGDVAGLLREHRVAVLPSRSEAMPMFVLEAMAQARPVVATAVGELGDVLPPEQLVPSGDSGALADRLSELMSDPDLATRRGRANRDTVLEHHGADRIRGCFDTVYRSMHPHTAPRQETTR